MSDLSQLNTRSMRNRVSPAEWATRVDLAACYRLVHHYGMDDLVYNHISARVPGEEGHFLINAYGMTYDEITASSLVKIDFDGNVVEDSGTGYGINHAGFVIHSAVHRGRPDVACVIHTHTPAGMAESATTATRARPSTSTSSVGSSTTWAATSPWCCETTASSPSAPPSPRRSSPSTGSSAPARRRPWRWRPKQN